MNFAAQFEYHKIPEWQKIFNLKTKIVVFTQSMCTMIKSRQNSNRPKKNRKQCSPLNSLECILSLQLQNRCRRCENNLMFWLIQKILLPEILSKTLKQSRKYLENDRSSPLLEPLLERENVDGKVSMIRPVTAKLDDFDLDEEEELELEKELIRNELSKRVFPMQLQKILYLKCLSVVLDSLKKKRNQSLIGSVLTKSKRASIMKIEDVDETKLIEQLEQHENKSVNHESVLHNYQQVQILKKESSTKSPLLSSKSIKFAKKKPHTNLTEQALQFELPKTFGVELFADALVSKLENAIAYQRLEQDAQEIISMIVTEAEKVEKFFVHNFHQLREEFNNLENQLKEKEKDLNRQHSINQGGGQHVVDVQRTTSKDFFGLKNQLPHNHGQSSDNLLIIQKHEGLLAAVENIEGTRHSQRQSVASHAHHEHHHKPKDEFDVATDWERPYIQLYTKLRWLNAYARINYIALQRAIHKFMETFFTVTDNILDKKLVKFVDDQTFSSKKNVKIIISDIETAYAEKFTNGDLIKAQNELSESNSVLRSKDTFQIAFYSGMIAIIFLEILFSVLIPRESKIALEWDQLIANAPGFRFMTMLIASFAFIGINVMYLRRFKVNYVFIMEFDPTYKITHVQIFRVTLMLLAILTLCFSVQLNIIKLNYIFPQAVGAGTMALFGLMLVLLFTPLHCTFLKARIALGRILFNIFISPFGQVKFRHFFIADMLTSFVQPLKDLGTTMCFFFCTYYDPESQQNIFYWKNSEKVVTSNHAWLQVYFYVVAILPLWFRFAQCFVRYRETKVPAHLKNAGKYFLGIATQAASIFMANYNSSTTSVIVYTLIAFTSSAVSYSWDIYMDWGLMRAQDKQGRKFLRSKVMLPRWYYYYAAGTNLIMRFMWILPLFNSYYAPWFIQYQLNVTVLGLIEIIRRAQWAVIRIENENVNNFEKYRNILQIPEFEDDIHAQSRLKSKKKVKKD